MKLKFFIFIFCLAFFIFNLNFQKNINAESSTNSDDSNIVTNLEDFEIQDMRIVVYEQSNDFKVGYLFEGVTESYMIYDNINNIIVLYCFDSHSPWYLYPSTFENAGCLYLSNNVYSYINLETDELNLKGDIEVINQDIEIESNPLIADLFNLNINEPNNLNFNLLFTDHIIDSHIIENSYYFERLNKNIGINNSNTCQYVAVNMLLSYYDTFYDDTLVSDDYIIDTNIINRHNFDMVVESPGGGELLDAHLKNLLIDQNIENTYAYLYLDIINDYLTNAGYESEDGLDLINVVEFDYLDGTYDSDEFYEVKDILKQNYPVFLGVDPGYYFDNTTNTWVEDVPGGHAVVAYGYYLTDIETANLPTTTYFLTNMGFYDEFNQYKYTKMLMYNGYYGIYEGFTFIPNNNYQHHCSDSYIYTIGDCELGLCPCDQYLSDDEFYNKYCNLVVTNGFDEFYCKNHDNLHLIYRREHEHIFEYTKINDELHYVSCVVPGCNQNFQEEHEHIHQINSTHTDHYDICLCGDVIYLNYDFHHITHWDNSHLKVCNLCGLSQLIRDYQSYAVSEHYHEYYCEVCDIIVTEQHTYVYEEVDDDKHIRRCIHCDYYEITFHESWGNVLEYYWNPTNNYYDVYCILCGNHHISYSNEEDE